MNDSQACCAHCRVVSKHLDNPDGSQSEYWECAGGCGQKFEPVYFTPAQKYPNFKKVEESDKPLKSLQSVCQEADDITKIKKGTQREAYGHPLDDYTCTVNTFNALTGHKLTPEQGILFMICVKLSRENRNPKRDNRVDICGYTKCLDEVQNEVQMRKIF